MLFNSRRRPGIDRPGIDDLASLEHSEAIREIEHERDMLFHDEHGGPLLAPRQLQYLGNPVNDAWLQALGNFVEQENAGLRDQASRAAEVLQPKMTEIPSSVSSLSASFR